MPVSVDIDMEKVHEIEHDLGFNAKKPVDENAPKRPMSAFFLWSDTVRADVIKNNLDCTPAEVGKKMGEMWNDLPASTKESFSKKYRKNREAFSVKWEKYQKTGSYRKHQQEFLAWKIHQTKKPFGRNPNAPKRYPTAYMLYSDSVRAGVQKDNPDFTMAEVMKKIASQWQELGDSEKKPFNAETAKLKAKFEKDLKRYFESDDYREWEEKKKAYKTKMLGKRNRLMGVKPERKKKKAKRSRSVSRKRSRSRRRTSRRTSRRSRRSTSRRRSRRSRRSRTPKSRKRRRVSRRRSSKKR